MKGLGSRRGIERHGGTNTGGSMEEGQSKTTTYCSKGHLSNETLP